MHRVGNSGWCGCETISREVLPQVEIPEKWTQGPPCFAITIGVWLRSHTNQGQYHTFCCMIYHAIWPVQFIDRLDAQNHLTKCHFRGQIKPGGWFNKKRTSYQYRKSHCGDKTILRPSYLHYGISYTGKTTSLYWIRAQVIIFSQVP